MNVPLHVIFVLKKSDKATSSSFFFFCFHKTVSINHRKDILGDGVSDIDVTTIYL